MASQPGKVYVTRHGLKWRRMLSYPCYLCKAKVGEPCRTRTKVYKPHQFHVEYSPILVSST